VAEQTLANWVKAKGAGKFKEVSGKGRVTTEQMEIDKTDFDIPTVRTATR